MRPPARTAPTLLTVALGSCDQVRALLEAAVALGVLSPEEQQRADALPDRVCAMTFRFGCG